MSYRALTFQPKEVTEIGNNQFLKGGAMVREKLDEGFTEEIPADYQYLVYGKYDVQGTLIVTGTMVVL